MSTRHYRLVALVVGALLVLGICLRHARAVRADLTPPELRMTVAAEHLLALLLGPGRATPWVQLHDGRLHADVTYDSVNGDQAARLRPGLESLLSVNYAGGDRLELVPLPGHRARSLAHWLWAAGLAVLAAQLLTLAALGMLLGTRRYAPRWVAWPARIAGGVLLLGFPLWWAARIPHLSGWLILCLVLGRPWRVPSVARARLLLGVVVVGVLGSTWLVGHLSPEETLRREMGDRLSAQWVLLAPRGTAWGGVVGVPLNPGDPCAAGQLGTLEAAVRQARPDLRLSLIGVPPGPAHRAPWLPVGLLALATVVAAWKRPRAPQAVPASAFVPEIQVELGPGLLLESAAVDHGLGIVVPPVEVVQDLTLAPREWRILVRGVEARRGFDSVELAQVVRAHAEKWAGLDETAALLDNLQRAGYPHLVTTARERFGLLTLSQILRGLLREGVSVRDLRTILTALLDAPEPDVEAVRLALAGSICQDLRRQELAVAELPYSLEQLVRRGDDDLEPLYQAVAELFHGRPAVLVVPAALRPRVRGLLARRFPDLTVLSDRELPPEGLNREG